MAMLQIDLNRMRADIQQLDVLLNGYWQQLEKLNETEQAMQSMWRGTARDEFHKEFGTNLAQTERLVDAVTRFSEAAKQAMWRYQMAEQKAAAIAGNEETFWESIMPVWLERQWWLNVFRCPQPGMLIDLSALFRKDGEILVEPERLVEAAAEFSAAAVLVQKASQSMLEQVRTMSGYWMGEAASVFVAKFNGLQDDMEKVVRMIQEFSSDLQEIAQNYRAAEQQNTADFESLAADVIV